MSRARGPKRDRLGALGADGEAWDFIYTATMGRPGLSRSMQAPPAQVCFLITPFQGSFVVHQISTTLDHATCGTRIRFSQRASPGHDMIFPKDFTPDWGRMRGNEMSGASCSLD